MEYFANSVNNWFPPVVPGVENSELFAEMVAIELLSDQVVRRLEQIEREFSANWCKDKELLTLFDSLYTSGCIMLPRDPVDRIRWIALACVFFSKQKGFSYGNILIPHDWVPDNELDSFEDWGYFLIEETRMFRAELNEKGWVWLCEPA